jgi:predicted phage tail protein
MEPVFEQALVARYGFNQLEMTAIGCTRQSEANRKGRWGILTNNKDRVVSFDVGLDGNIPQPGYIIAWQTNCCPERLWAAHQCR